ncbi:MogA/MoaB family molybdenum cofactor biosynthesis protein [Corynebacterium uterequi]|uniref:Molybdopterin biosynthesis enzyme n=1 Tax=Corynebacterium uterequi TaxID=1072256 RepID=A0A0G3HBQ2_9CORY|nr:molybdopterin-binding protein [Corynebacterium uterequi]AKK10699.1 molybdopterin biosynthesis enzyme [Corynebacterium uterequi]
MNHSVTELSLREDDGRLRDLEGPDANYLRTAEEETKVRSHRRALAVVIADHCPLAGPDAEAMVAELLSEAKFEVDAVVRVASKKSQIRKAIETAVVGGVDLVVTIGGVGVGPRDKAPEATRQVLDQMVPGVAQALRSSGQACGAVDAACSRGISGISGQTVVVNLAGSRAAVRDGMATLPPLVHHLIDQLGKYCV